MEGLYPGVFDGKTHAPEEQAAFGHDRVNAVLDRKLHNGLCPVALEHWNYTRTAEHVPVPGLDMPLHEGVVLLTVQRGHQFAHVCVHQVVRCVSEETAHGLVDPQDDPGLVHHRVPVLALRPLRQVPLQEM